MKIKILNGYQFYSRNLPAGALFVFSQNPQEIYIKKDVGYKLYDY